MLACALVNCDKDGKKCTANKADVQKTMKKMHEAKQALVKNHPEIKDAKKELSEHRNKDHAAAGKSHDGKKT
jgi:hypothetical protein